MQQQPVNPAVTQAHQLLQRRQHAQAGALLERHLKKNPKDPAALHLLAVCYMEAGRSDLATDRMNKAIALAPNNPGFLCDLAQMHLGAQEFDLAEKAVDKAIAVDPSFAYAIGAKAELLQTVGRLDEAAALASEAAEKHPDNARVVLAFASIAKRLKQERRAIELLEAILKGDLQQPARAAALFRLGAMHEALGEYETAWKRFTDANALIPSHFDREGHARNVDRMIESWTPATAAAAPQSNQRSEQPVFIVGMPRSGTSLVEQIAASHPRVFGAGELLELPILAAKMNGQPGSGANVFTDPGALHAKALNDAARQFLGFLYKRGARGDRVTDKLPINFYLVGLISRLFPNARIIHCERNAIDTCVSCFTNHFQGAYHWAYQLDHLGWFHNDYTRLMRHWIDTLDFPIHTVVYEKLIDDLDGESRRLIDFLGLEWDDACLEFHASKRVVTTLSNEQVRQPIYKSSAGRWRNYQPWLGDLIDALDHPPTDA